MSTLRLQQGIDCLFQLSSKGEASRLEVPGVLPVPGHVTTLMQSLPNEGVELSRLRHCLNRHIELDANDHGPLARRLVDSLCQNNQARDQAARKTACRAIRSRIQLWNGILGTVQSLVPAIASHH